MHQPRTSDQRAGGRNLRTVTDPAKPSTRGRKKSEPLHSSTSGENITRGYICSKSFSICSNWFMFVCMVPFYINSIYTVQMTKIKCIVMEWCTRVRFWKFNPFVLKNHPCCVKCEKVADKHDRLACIAFSALYICASQEFPSSLKWSSGTMAMLLAAPLQELEVMPEELWMFSVCLCGFSHFPSKKHPVLV